MRTLIPVRRFRARSSWLLALLRWGSSGHTRLATWWRRTTGIAVLVIVAACGATPPVANPASAERVVGDRNLGEPAWWWWHQGTPALQLDGLRWPTRERLDGASASWSPSETRSLRFVEEPDRDELLDRQARRLAAPTKEIHVRPTRARSDDGHR